MSSPDREPERPSLGHIALGAAALGVRGAGRVVATGGRAARVLSAPPRMLWGLGPGLAVTPVLSALADRGRREQRQLRVRAGTTVEEVAAMVLESPELERVLASMLENPAFQRVGSGVIDAPGLEKLIVRVLDSTLVDDLTDRVLASEELERVVRHVARSEEVRDALTQQSAGLANEVAGQMRARTAAADDVVERFARGILRRRSGTREDAERDAT